MNALLFWVVPPLAGAIIGYVTNAVAIKMLFRPLREIRLLGLRLPFTPGILPRQRHILAEGIGRMVERELLTPEVLRERLNRPAVREEVQRSLSRHTAEILSTALEKSIFSAENDPLPPGGFRNLAANLVRNFFDSPVFDALCDALLAVCAGGGGKDQAETAELPHASLRDILGEENLESFRPGLERFLDETLRSRSSGVAGSLKEFMWAGYPRTISSLIAFLRREDIFRELTVQGGIILDRVINKLNVLQRLFISASQYDKTLEEKIPEIIDEFILRLEEILRDEAIKQRILNRLYGMAAEFLSRNPGGGISRGISAFIIDCAALPLDEIFLRLSGEAPGKTLRRLIMDKLSGREEDEGESFFRRLARIFLARNPGVTLEDFLFPDQALREGKKEELDNLLTEKILAAGEKEADSLLKTINVRAMVTERIDSLDILQVERIVLDVMANQLKWINVFGAIIGAFIGILQPLLRLLTE